MCACGACGAGVEAQLKALGVKDRSGACGAGVEAQLSFEIGILKIGQIRAGGAGVFLLVLIFGVSCPPRCLEPPASLGTVVLGRRHPDVQHGDVDVEVRRGAKRRSISIGGSLFPRRTTRIVHEDSSGAGKC